MRNITKFQTKKIFKVKIIQWKIFKVKNIQSKKTTKEIIKSNKQKERRILFEIIAFDAVPNRSKQLISFGIEQNGPLFITDPTNIRKLKQK